MNIPLQTSRVASVLLAILTLGLSPGCRSIGPGTVPRDRHDYSSSISESWKRQTLLNIVKLRYLDPPIFVDVGQIVAGYSFETAVSAGVGLPETDALGGSAVNLGGSARFSDRPTITYTPLTGNHFVKSLMTPLPPESVFFAIQSGWPADGVLVAAAASLNGLRNAETSIAGVEPATPGFLRVLELLRSLQRSGSVSFRVRQDASKQQSSLLTFRSEGVSEATRAESRELRQLLRLNAEAEEFTLVFGSTASNDRELAVLTRTLMHIMTTMSAQVQVPAAHVSEGRATPGSQEGQEVLRPEQLVQIHSGREKPVDAFVSVRYRDTWFWIDDRDLRSKRAFSFMMILFTLSDSGQKESLPLITIPAQ